MREVDQASSPSENDEHQAKHALNAYKKGEITLSRAVQLAGISYREMLSLLSEKEIKFNYDNDDLLADIATTKRFAP